MSLEDQYDAWVRGLMGGGKYAATPQQAEYASDAVQQMQAQLDALTAAQKRTATRAEKALANGTGTDASPANLGWEGWISGNDASDIRSAQ